MGSLCVYLLILTSEGLEKTFSHWMLFLRDSLLGGSTVDEAEISPNLAYFVPLHQLFLLLLTVRQKQTRRDNDHIQCVDL